MKRPTSFCVIGIGQFGFNVSQALVAHGMDVLAIDSDEGIIDTIKDQVTQAICLRITDEESMRGVGIDEFETVIVAIGENFTESVLITALLKKKLKTPNVIVCSTTSIHREILELIGANHVILPEQETGRRLADKLCFSDEVFIHVNDNFSVTPLKAPIRFVDQTVQDLELATNYEVTLIGKEIGEDVIPLSPDYKIEEGDVLILFGANKQLERLLEL